MNIVDIIKMTAESNSPQELEARLMAEYSKMTEEEVKEFTKTLNGLNHEDVTKLVMEMIAKEYQR